MTEFSFETTVDVRYQDLDAMGHVNNAVYATYLEEARSAYIAEGMGIPPADISAVVAHLELDFERPVTDADAVTVAVAVTDVGEKSCTMAYEIRAGGDVAATAETVLVALDPETGAPTRVPADWREGVREIEGEVPTSSAHAP